MAQSEWMEEIKVEGAHLADEVKRVIHEGNVKHIIVKHNDNTVFEIPVTLGVVAVVLAPVLAAVAAVGGLLTHCTLQVVRVGEPPVGY